MLTMYHGTGIQCGCQCSQETPNISSSALTQGAPIGWPSVVLPIRGH